MPPSITIQVTFDKTLQDITGKASHPVIMSQNAPFMFLLQNIFEEYPEIMEKYKPGEFGFTINGIPPKEYSPLFDGDVVAFKII
ncbi:MAG: hypothetical protein NTV98_05165 [Candidatus Roizmanbacteria bacterium]|nr:hypothetical protein [Candidatus Roizmanbacteria bacterium]